MKERFPLLTVLVLLLVVVVHHRIQLARLSDALVRMGPIADRTVLRDRLIGRQLELDLFLGSAQIENLSPRTLLWVIDLDRCRGCLGKTTDLDRFGQAKEIGAIVLVVGDPSAEDSQQLKALQHTNIIHVERTVLVTLLPLIPANTKVLIDDSGFVLMMEARDNFRPCAWSFEGQVGSLLGLNSPRMIRGSFFHESPEVRR